MGKLATGYKSHFLVQFSFPTIPTERANFKFNINICQHLRAMMNLVSLCNTFVRGVYFEYFF